MLHSVRSAPCLEAGRQAPAILLRHSFAPRRAEPRPPVRPTPPVHAHMWLAAEAMSVLQLWGLFFCVCTYSLQHPLSLPR